MPKRTAIEWVDELRRVLGGAGSAPGSEVEEVQPVRQVTEPFVTDQGPDAAFKVPHDTRFFTSTTLATYIQAIPKGYYDSVQVAVATTITTNRSLPLFCSLESLKSVEGVNAMGVTVGNFVIEHPPFKSVPAQSNSNSLEINVPLTNSPLIVWLDDGIAPGANTTVMVRVTFMTRRH